MLRLISLVLLAFLLPSSMARDCWSGNIVHACLLFHQQSRACEEFMLGHDSQTISAESERNNAEHWISVCVPCEVVETDNGITCPVKSNYSQDGENFNVDRARLFIYLASNHQHDSTISFDHVNGHGQSAVISIHIRGPVNGQPVGPFYVDATHQPLTLTSLRCVDDQGRQCDVQFGQRRPFAFVHYIKENSQP